ncbi:MAG: cystathionine gamma-synthase [Micropruina sp.]|uniref:cystathionine gamma-synthase n=1 Tax=Micropruina sp. TaxID=2737536 RepID=UPI0039E6D34C
MSEPSPITRAVRAGIDTDLTHGAVVPPIYLSTTYTFAEFGVPRPFDYARRGNPTRSTVADAIAGLEGGAGGVVTASGMGAITAVISALLSPGDVLVAPHDCYGGSWRLFDALARKGNIDLVLADLTDPVAARQVIDDRRPTVLWLESPSNPLLRITDIATLAGHGHRVGATVVVDNTFCTPLGQRPLELGADLVVHSATKYIAGHSDVVAGAIVAADQAVADDIAWWANCLGVTGGAFDSYLVLRGLRTLHARMAIHESNGAAVVRLLDGHPAVAAVHHPSLPGHPGHALAAAQQRLFGGIVTFDLHGGLDAAKTFMEGLTLFCPAESLGGTESLVSHPSSMTHASMPPDVQLAAGITPGMIRLSVGIEQIDDLLADLSGALDLLR